MVLEHEENAVAPDFSRALFIILGFAKNMVVCVLKHDYNEKDNQYQIDDML